MLLAVKSITVPDGRRPLRDLTPLIESIRERGLLQPIVVTKDMRLIAGLHRLEAYRAMGASVIPAQVIDVDEIDARLAEIDENLIRNELTVLERAEALKRRKELYEQRYPVTRNGGPRPGAGRGADRRRESDRQLDDLKKPPAFTEATAALLGCSRNKIERDIRIANRLTAEAKAEIRGTTLQDNQEALLTVVETTEPARQLEIVRSRLTKVEAVDLVTKPGSIGKKRTGKRSPHREKPRVEEVVSALTNARTAWNAMTAEWRDTNRTDMVFAVQAKAEVADHITEAIKALLRIVEQCEKTEAA
jgi:ParB family chromosome partitioning protein